MMRRKGSLTVEAALILPLVLFLFAFAMEKGISFYVECAETAASVMEEEEPDVVRKFYLIQGLGELLGDGD